MWARRVRDQGCGWSRRFGGARRRRQTTASHDHLCSATYQVRYPRHRALESGRTALAGPGAGDSVAGAPIAGRGVIAIAGEGARDVVGLEERRAWGRTGRRPVAGDRDRAGDGVSLQLYATAVL